MDIGAGELGAKAFSETDLREFRRGVRAHLRDAALADDRRDEQEMPGALLPEHRQRRASGVEGAEVVDVEELPHVLVRDLVQRPFDAESGVADHHVQSVEALDGLAHEPLHVLFARDVGDDRQRPAAGGFDVADQRVAAGRRGGPKRPPPRRRARGEAPWLGRFPPTPR